MDAFHGRKEETLDASNAEVSSVSEDGAGGGTRTHTMSPSADFESATSTIPSHRHAVEKYISFEAKYQVFCCDFSYPLSAVPVQPAMDINAI